MSRKIIGVTVGTPMKPQAVIEQTEQAVQIEENTKAIEELDKNKSDKKHTHDEYLTSIPSEYVTETELANKGYAKATDIPTEYAPTDAQKNQNAFGKLYFTNFGTIEAPNEVSEIGFKESDGIDFDVDIGRDSDVDIKIINSGVHSITTGTSNGTILVNTNGKTAEVSVKGLGSSAFKNASDFAPSDHSHDEYVTSVPVEVAVQNNQPTEGTLWIDTDSTDEINLAEIDDNTVSDEKTWSSAKISSLLVDGNEVSY